MLDSMGAKTFTKEYFQKKPETFSLQNYPFCHKVPSQITCFDKNRIKIYRSDLCNSQSSLYFFQTFSQTYNKYFLQICTILKKSRQTSARIARKRCQALRTTTCITWLPAKTSIQ